MASCTRRPSVLFSNLWLSPFGIIGCNSQFIESKFISIWILYQMRFSIYWIIIYLHPDNLPKFHLTSSKGVPKCDCVPVIECFDVECWSAVLCAKGFLGFGYMIKCVACSCRRLVGGLQCLVEVHSLPAFVLDLARPVANLLPPPQENGRVGRLATITIWRNVRSVDRQKSCRSALLTFVEVLEILLDKYICFGLGIAIVGQDKSVCFGLGIAFVVWSP